MNIGSGDSQAILHLDDNNSGNLSVNYRLKQSRDWDSFTLTSTKTDIDNSQFWVNEYGIPAGSLDITFPASATTLGIASTSANDTSAGAGAQAIQIEGLDANYSPIVEVVLLNGQTEVNSTKSFLRVNGAIVVAVGSGDKNDGIIYISSSTDSFVNGIPQTTVYRTIGTGVNFSTPGTYTIRAGYSGTPTEFLVSSDATEAKPLLVRGIIKPFGLPELLAGELVFSSSDSFFFHSFPVFGEKTDLIIRTQAKNNTDVDSGVVFWGWNIRKNT